LPLPIAVPLVASVDDTLLAVIVEFKIVMKPITEPPPSTAPEPIADPTEPSVVDALTIAFVIVRPLRNVDLPAPVRLVPMPVPPDAVMAPLTIERRPQEPSWTVPMPAALAPPLATRDAAWSDVIVMFDDEHSRPASLAPEAVKVFDPWSWTVMALLVMTRGLLFVMETLERTSVNVASVTVIPFDPEVPKTVRGEPVKVEAEVEPLQVSWLPTRVTAPVAMLHLVVM
jgi:hypothetical protein